ncbi:GNAT family N-acetyltransferase [Pseudonocardia humida]|uniref:GNAT family N-acetyltransferase n=1 Tax=Pseudonocardia humida TaxID=2800819 RepID=A0ABT1AB79_9PSEU|nr:GNAT family N-acetyltransferase [Pseudonocardia humida]MCO1660185.1 GNAT family N-acetyltransferase [Pseudonocardia humida]
MEIEIVAGTVDDVEAIGPLWRSMVAHHEEVIGARMPVRDAAAAWEMRHVQYRRWLAEDSGFLRFARRPDEPAPIGYGFFRLVPSGPTFDLGDVRGEVESLAVAPAARGTGAGTALLEAGREELLRRGCTFWTVNVVEINTGAVALYERVGFRSWTRDLVGRL